MVFSGRSAASTPEQAICLRHAGANAEDVSIATQPRPERVAVPMPLVVNERYLEVREMVTDKVITAIELLSPKNKKSGEGRTLD